jgi:cell division ATPase FtsA
VLERLGRGIVLTGGGAAIHNQDTLFGVKCDMPVRVGLPIGFDDLPESLDLPEWAPVMGIVKYAIAHRKAIESGRLTSQYANNNSLFAYLRRVIEKYFVGNISTL